MITTQSGQSDSVVFSFAQAQGGRAYQEDFFAQTQSECFFIADGIGGAPEGERASRLAVEQGILAFNILSKRKFYQRAKKHLLREMFKTASRTVFYEQKNHPGMGTTLVVLCIGVKNWWLNSVGDSRGYLFDHGVLKQVTTDHEAPDGRIIRWIGMEKHVQPDTFEGELQSGQVFMLATDGMFGVAENEMKDILSSVENLPESVESAAKQLIERALELDGSDNATVCIVKKL